MSPALTVSLSSTSGDEITNSPATVSFPELELANSASPGIPPAQAAAARSRPASGICRIGVGDLPTGAPLADVVCLMVNRPPFGEAPSRTRFAPRGRTFRTPGPGCAQRFRMGVWLGIRLTALPPGLRRERVEF